MEFDLNISYGNVKEDGDLFRILFEGESFGIKYYVRIGGIAFYLFLEKGEQLITYARKTMSTLLTYGLIPKKEMQKLLYDKEYCYQTLGIYSGSYYSLFHEQIEDAKKLPLLALNIHSNYHLYWGPKHKFGGYYVCKKWSLGSRGQLFKWLISLSRGELGEIQLGEIKKIDSSQWEKKKISPIKIEQNFHNYLIERYSKNSVNAYIYQIRKVCKESNIKKWNDFEKNIDELLRKYQNDSYVKSALNLVRHYKMFSVKNSNRGIQQNFTKYPSNHQFTQKSAHANLNDSKMTKSEAVSLALQNDLNVSANCTFASLNSGVSKYWANPNIRVLSDDWWLICNDSANHKLYYFCIPQNSLDEENLVVRKDKPNLIDLQIYYNDETFTDSRSKISFAEWLVKSIDY